MSLQINYYVAPNDQFVVYDPNKKTNKTVSYSTLISKIRADVSTYNTGGTVTSISTSSPLTGGVITATGVIGITQSGATSDGYLSSADWNTFNGKGASYVYTQVTPSAVWVVLHNLNKYPSSTVVNSADEVVYGETAYDSLNQVSLTVAGAVSGKACFN